MAPLPPSWGVGWGGWQLGKHSAVYNSAYVHCSWGLWVSQKGHSLCLCPQRWQKSQLYGNGCQRGGGALPHRCLNQSRSAQMLKIREARLPSRPLNPGLTRSFCCDTESRVGATWLNLTFVLPASSPAGTQARTPSLAVLCLLRQVPRAPCLSLPTLPLSRELGQSRLLLFAEPRKVL